MGWPLSLGIVVLYCCLSSSFGYDNVTLDGSTASGRWETEESCSAGKWGSCLEGGVLASFSALVGPEYRLSEGVRIVREAKAATEQRGSAGFLASLARAGDDFLRSAGLEVELTPELTEGGRYQPRFVDEIYTELDTLELKKVKPHILAKALNTSSTYSLFTQYSTISDSITQNMAATQMPGEGVGCVILISNADPKTREITPSRLLMEQYELKKLFIPLLVVLKLFKLKLLFLLPLILGVASFKKLLGIAFFVLPAIIAYFKICKPDSSHSYGNFGHSSFYNAPPGLSEHAYAEDGTAYDRMSYRDLPDAQRLAYKGYYREYIS